MSSAVAPVRTEVGRPPRDWERRLHGFMVRHPRLWRRLSRRRLRLAPASRVRTRMGRVATSAGFDLLARRNFDLTLPPYAADIELYQDPSWRGLGFDEVYRGHDGLLRFMRDWWEAWGETDMTLRAIVDAEATLVALVDVRTRGRASGARLDVRLGAVMRFDPATGLIREQRNFTAHEAALREAGFA